MEQSSSLEVKGASATQEIPHLLWNPKAHYRIHKRPPPFPILSHINPVHVPHLTSWRSTLMLSSHLRLVLPLVSFPRVSPPKPYTHLSPVRATFLAHLIVLELISRIIFGEEYRSLSTSLCSLLQSSVISTLLNTLCSNILSLGSSLDVSDQVPHPYARGGKILCIEILILIFIFLVSKLTDSRICTEWQQAFPDFNLFLISSLTYAWCPFNSCWIWSIAVIGIENQQIIFYYWSVWYTQFCWSMSHFHLLVISLHRYGYISLATQRSPSHHNPCVTHRT